MAKNGKSSAMDAYQMGMGMANSNSQSNLHRQVIGKPTREQMLIKSRY